MKEHFYFSGQQRREKPFEFLENHELDEFHFVGIDDIFDYFEPSIKSVQSDSSYEWYRNLQHALSKANENEASHTAAARILKVVAAIGIINDSSALVADKGTITSVIDLPKDTLENALSELCAKKILKYSGAYKRYDFFEASIFDVEELIKDGSGRVQDKAIIDTLNECFVDFVLYPYQYNRLYKINRVFLPVFAFLKNCQGALFPAALASTMMESWQLYYLIRIQIMNNSQQTLHFWSVQSLLHILTQTRSKTQ